MSDKSRPFKVPDGALDLQKHMQSALRGVDIEAALGLSSSAALKELLAFQQRDSERLALMRQAMGAVLPAAFEHLTSGAAAMVDKWNSSLTAASEALARTVVWPPPDVAEAITRAVVWPPPNVSEAIAQLEAPSRLPHVEELTRLSRSTVEALGGHALGATLGMAARAQRQLASEFDAMVSSYEALFAPLRAGFGLSTLPDLASIYPPTSLLAHASALEIISVPRRDRTPSEEGRPRFREEAATAEHALRDALVPYPRLQRVWIGALKARHSDNPDRVCHFASSVRKLLARLLDRAAPVDTVAAWSEAQGTRESSRIRSRFRYVAHVVTPHGDLAQFVASDAQAMFGMWARLNAAIHTECPDLNEEELDRLTWRAARWILDLLKAGVLAGN